MNNKLSRVGSSNTQYQVQKSPEQIFKENLAVYDSRYTTLVDYVTMIGISNSDLYEAI
jgi:hypothetical protein